MKCCTVCSVYSRMYDSPSDDVTENWGFFVCATVSPLCNNLVTSLLPFYGSSYSSKQPAQRSHGLRVVYNAQQVSNNDTTKYLFNVCAPNKQQDLARGK